LCFKLIESTGCKSSGTVFDTPKQQTAQSTAKFIKQCCAMQMHWPLLILMPPACLMAMHPAQFEVAEPLHVYQ